MKALKAFWRFLFAPQFELWWSGFFLCQLLYLLQSFPDSPTGWQIANLCLTFALAVICSYDAVKYLRKVRA